MFRKPIALRLVCLVLMITILFPTMSVANGFQAIQDEKIFLPSIFGKKGSGPTDISSLIKQVVEQVLFQRASQLTVSDVSFDFNTLSLHFNSPSELNLLDTPEFEDTIKAVNNAVNPLLVQQGFPEPHNYDYEIFINGQVLWQGAALEEVSELSPAASNTSLVVVSPGHGWGVSGNNWRLDRGYHYGIVEDFVNAELVMELQGLLQAASIESRSPRNLDKNAGNHPNGYPWWQMGSSEYVRSLGAPSTVWGQFKAEGYNRNVVAPPEYANWIGANLLVSIHNNGGEGCGTETWYEKSNGYADQSRRLAVLIQNKLIERLRASYNPKWCNRGVKGSAGGYGENRRFKGPAVIVELAFMDTESNNNALKDPRFRTIAMTAVRDAIMEYLGTAPTPPINIPPSIFSGNPTSRLFFDQNGARANLEVCSDNLSGQKVYAQLSKQGNTLSTVSQVSSGRCVTFWDLDGPGTLLSGTLYSSRASLNQPPNAAWPIPCYSATGGRGLCDAATTSVTVTNVIKNGLTELTIDNNSVNLMVCGDNLAGKLVYTQMWRKATNGYSANTWNFSQQATGNCVTFGDMDGVGGTFTGVDYFTVAAIEKIGSAEAAQQRTSCYGETGGVRLCDHVSRASLDNSFINGYSRLTINTTSVNLEVCGDNLFGKTVYAQMWRNAANGYPAKTWIYSKASSGNCVTFGDMDGVGNTFTGVNYYTVAAIEPIGSTEAAQARTSCYAVTGGKRLCDLGRR